VPRSRCDAIQVQSKVKQGWLFGCCSGQIIEETYTKKPTSKNNDAYIEEAIRSIGFPGSLKPTDFIRGKGWFNTSCYSIELRQQALSDYLESILSIAAVHGPTRAELDRFLSPMAFVSAEYSHLDDEENQDLPNDIVF